MRLYRGSQKPLDPTARPTNEGSTNMLGAAFYFTDGSEVAEYFGSPFSYEVALPAPCLDLNKEVTFEVFQDVMGLFGVKVTRANYTPPFLLGSFIPEFFDQRTMDDDRLSRFPEICKRLGAASFVHICDGFSNFVEIPRNDPRAQFKRNVYGVFSLEAVNVQDVRLYGGAVVPARSKDQGVEW